MTYPTAVDSFTTKTNHTGVVDTGATNINFAEHINALQAAITAIEAKLGINASTPSGSSTSGDVLQSTTTPGESAWANKTKLTTGTAAAPTYSFQSDTDTGTFRVGANILGWSTGGAERGRISSNGLQASMVDTGGIEINVHGSSYGAVGDGTTDDTTALQNAVNALGALGGTVRLRPGCSYGISSTLLVGDGAGSLTAASTLQRVTLRGGGIGPGSNSLAAVSEIKWIGASGGGPVVKFLGQEGGGLIGLRIQANNLASIALQLYNVNICRFEDVAINQVKASSSTFGGIAIQAEQCSRNVFDNVIVTCQQGASGSTGSTGLTLGADSANDATTGNSQNEFRKCEFNWSNTHSTSYGIYLRNADNNSFIQCHTLPNGGETSGYGVYFAQATNTIFPQENAFVNTATQGGVGGTGGTGGNKFDPYPTSDGEPIPSLPYVTFVTYDHAYDYGNGDVGAVSLFNSKLRAAVINPDAFASVASSSSVSNTASEQTLSTTYTVPAGKLNRAGTIFRLEANGIYSSVAGTATFLVKLLLGGQVIAQATITPGTASGNTWEMQATGVVRTTGATASVQRGGGPLWFQAGNPRCSTVGGAVTLDLTSTLSVQVKVTMGAADPSNAFQADSVRLVPVFVDHTA